MMTRSGRDPRVCAMQGPDHTAKGHVPTDSSSASASSAESVDHSRWDANLPLLTVPADVPLRRARELVATFSFDVN